MIGLVKINEQIRLSLQKTVGFAVKRCLQCLLLIEVASGTKKSG